MKTVRLLMTIAALLAFAALANGQNGTFTETHTIQCGDSVFVGGLGYPTWNDPHIIRPPKWGFAKLYGDFVAANLLIYQSPPCFEGKDTVIIECAHATQITCDTGIYVFDIVCNEAIDPALTYQVNCSDTFYVGNLSGWWLPSIFGGPEHGSARIILGATDGAGVEYIPEVGFEGLDYVKVSTLNQDTLLYLFQVSCTALAVQDAAVQTLKMYPNPARDMVYFPEAPLNAHLRITDGLGRSQALLCSYGEQGLKANVGAFPAGLYFIQWSDGKNVWGGRLVIGL